MRRNVKFLLAAETEQAFQQIIEDLVKAESLAIAAAGRPALDTDVII